MEIKVRFKPLKGSEFTLVKVGGYRITTCITEVGGLRDNFRIYVFERYAASQPLKPIGMPSTGGNLVGTLTLTGAGREYEFSGIQFSRIDTVITHRERVRLLEFKYESTAEASDKKIPCELKVPDQKSATLDGKQLGDDYKYALAGFSEHLLGFRAQQSSGQSLLRFTSEFNDKNSWLRKIIELNESAVDNNDNIPEFDVKFRGGTIQVKPGDLEVFFVDESYGALLGYQIPPFSHIAAAITSKQYSALLPVTLTAPSPKIYVQDYNANDFSAGDLDNCIQTATIVFNNGAYRDLQVF